MRVVMPVHWAPGLGGVSACAEHAAEGAEVELVGAGGVAGAAVDLGFEGGVVWGDELAGLGAAFGFGGAGDAAVCAEGAWGGRGELGGGWGRGCLHGEPRVCGVWSRLVSVGAGWGAMGVRAGSRALGWAGLAGGLCFFSLGQGETRRHQGTKFLLHADDPCGGWDDDLAAGRAGSLGGFVALWLCVESLLASLGGWCCGGLGKGETRRHQGTKFLLHADDPCGGWDDDLAAGRLGAFVALCWLASLGGWCCGGLGKGETRRHQGTSSGFMPMILVADGMALAAGRAGSLCGFVALWLVGKGETRRHQGTKFLLHADDPCGGWDGDLAAGRAGSLGGFVALC